MSKKNYSPNAEAIDQAIADLAELTDSSAEGWTRKVLSEPYAEDRDFIQRRMTAAGREVRTDGAGNIIGRLPGTHGSNLKPLVTGSHTDTVHAGGRFDGIVGVLGALEAVETLRKAGVQLRRDLYVVDFLVEEANDFGAMCVGSAAVTGDLNTTMLQGTNKEGLKLGQAFERFGIDPNQAMHATWKSLSFHAYVELHIEQGPVLERSGSDIGVVTAITGTQRFIARFRGRPDHAGTTPMDIRRDAVAAAAEAVLTIEHESCQAPGHAVSTVGGFTVGDSALNVVPDDVRIDAEIRSIDAQWLTGAKRRLTEKLAADAERRGVAIVSEWLDGSLEPVLTTLPIRDHIAAAAEELGLKWEPIPSGAGHDAQHMAKPGPMGMIFIQSHNGRSHCPEEFTETKHIVSGVKVLCETLRRLDESDFLSA